MPHPHWSMIWKLLVPERVRSFLWLVQHERLLTNLRKSRMGLGSQFCNHCNAVSECILHVLRDCPHAKTVWSHLLKHDGRGLFFSCGLQQWIFLNLTASFGKDHSWNWGAAWGTACSLIWQWRNQSVHDSSFVRPSRPWEVVSHYLKNYLYATNYDPFAGMNVHHWVQVRWKAPQEGWVALNTDGSSKLEVKAARCGGLLRGANGKWLGGFAKNLGYCHAFIAELWGVCLGLQLAASQGHPNIEVQIDSQVVVSLLHGSGSSTSMGRGLLSRIRVLLQKFQAFRVLHTYREGNVCADILANMGCNSGDLGLLLYERPPVCIGHALNHDLMGTLYPKAYF